MYRNLWLQVDQGILPTKVFLLIGASYWMSILMVKVFQTVQELINLST